jgi:O-antigen/teichoic acid export membrane protein
MALIGTLRLVYEKITFTLLPSVTSLSAVGIFSSAARVVEAGKLGHQSALTAMYPEMARDEDFGKKMRGLQPLLIAAFLISVGLSLLAKPIVSLLFGTEFISAVLPLQIMAWTIVPYVLVTYVVVGLVALGYERVLLTSRFVILASLVSLLFVLTPSFGITGSAVAVLVTELIHAFLLWRLWRIHVLSKLS